MKDSYTSMMFGISELIIKISVTSSYRSLVETNHMQCPEPLNEFKPARRSKCLFKSSLQHI